MNDIYEQYRRILDENLRRNPFLSPGVEKDRVEKALGAFQRYAGNIGKMKSMQTKWYANKKFSRNTYMGLAEG